MDNRRREAIAMTDKTRNAHADPAETIHNLAHAKQQHAQRTPAWPGAKERAEPQHAHAPPVNEAAPGDVEKTPPSRSGYERSDINKRHH